MESVPGKYEYLPHTADAKFRAYGKDLSELFANAAEAMFMILADISVVERAQRHTLWIKAKTRDAALFDFLDQLLFLLDTEGFILNGFDDLRVTRNCDSSYLVTGTARGDTYKKYDKKYDVGGDIKAVTYNEMYTKARDEGGWEAQVVVDL